MTVGPATSCSESTVNSTPLTERPVRPEAEAVGLPSEVVLRSTLIVTQPGRSPVPTFRVANTHYGSKTTQRFTPVAVWSISRFLKARLLLLH